MSGHGGLWPTHRPPPYSSSGAGSGAGHTDRVGWRQVTHASHFACPVHAHPLPGNDGAARKTPAWQRPVPTFASATWPLSASISRLGWSGRQERTPLSSGVSGEGPGLAWLPLALANGGNCASVPCPVVSLEASSGLKRAQATPCGTG